MGQGYFDDGRIHVELGGHVFVTPSARRRNVVLAPHAQAGTVLDSGGGVLSLRVTAQRVRVNLGDAERYIFGLLHALACSGPGTLAFQDGLGNPATVADSVCVAAVGRVRAFRFADLSLDFVAPERSAEPEWGSVPDAPPEYAGTSSLQDYCAGGVTIGTHPVEMRIEMTRDYPLREIPRARGARATGPSRGGQIRFVVLAHALPDGQNLAAYLAALARQIGPRPITLEANGNTYDDVVLESLRPAHGDLRHTDFEAEFLMQVPPCVYPTSSTARATTTTPAGTTTEEAATTTTRRPTTTSTTTTAAPSTSSGQAPSTSSGQATTTARSSTTTQKTSTSTTTTAAPSTSSGQAPSTSSGQAPSTTSGQAATTTLPGPSTTSVAIPCNDCDPPHQHTYCVAFSGLAVDFAPANGSWTVDWAPLGEYYCRWLGFDIWPDVFGYDVGLGWDSIIGRWVVTLRKRLDCWKQWLGPTDPCDPSGVYVEHDCDDGACDSTNTCGNSMGAKCWVCADCPCMTTTAGPTSSTTPEASTTTALPTTTTQSPTTSTTEGPECPGNQHCVDNCAQDYYCADFDGCYCGSPPTCSGTMQWRRFGPGCAWDLQQSAGPCWSPQITCSGGVWFFTVNHDPTETSCQYEKGATQTSCPPGTYSKVAGDCPGCLSEVTVYA